MILLNNFMTTLGSLIGEANASTHLDIYHNNKNVTILEEDGNGPIKSTPQTSKSSTSKIGV